MDPNPLTAPRAGAIAIGNQAFNITQAGRVCLYSIDPIDLSSGSQPASGGTGTVRVTAPAGCSWSASSDVPWMSITSGSPGSGSGPVGYRVDPNPLATPRGGTLRIANLLFSVTQAGVSTGPTCVASTIPNVIRSTGLSELTADLTISCANVPAGGFTADLTVTLDRVITSRLAPAGNFSEVLLLVNEPATPVLGVNAFQGALTAYTTLQFSSVNIAPIVGSTAVLRVVNLRLNSISGSDMVNAHVAISSATGVSMVNPFTVAYRQQPAAAAVATAPATSDLTSMTLTVRESFATAFRIRTGAAQSPDFAAETGYWGPTLPGYVGAADTGTRIRAVFAVLPAVNVYAPVYPSGSQSAQLVSADAHGAGGSFLTGSAFGGTHVLLTPADGIVAATWEVRAANPTSVEQYSFNLIIEGATAEQLATILSRVTLAPVSTVAAASTTAPLPRFQDSAMPLSR